MDIKAASRVGSGRAHPGPLAPDYIMHGSVVCCSDRSDLSLGENLCVFRSAKFCSDPGRSAKFTANIQDLNISDPVIIGCNTTYSPRPHKRIRVALLQLRISTTEDKPRRAICEMQSE